MTLHHLNQLRLLRERREQQARTVVEQCRRNEIPPRELARVAQTEVDRRKNIRKQAADSCFLANDAQTSVLDQVGARGSLIRLDSQVEQGARAVRVAQAALDTAMNETRKAEAKLRIARTETEKSERGIERQWLEIRKEELSMEEAALDEQTDTHVMMHRASAIFRP